MIKSCRILPLCLVLPALFPSLATAADRTFRSSSGTNFSTLANWVEGVIPSSAQINDDLRLFGTNFTAAANNDIANLEFAAVVLDHSSSGVRRLTGNGLRLRGLESFLGSGRTFEFDVQLTVPVSATFDCGGNGTNTVKYNQPLTIAGSSTLTLTGSGYQEFNNQISSPGRSLDSTALLCNISNGSYATFAAMTTSFTGEVELWRGNLITKGFPGNAIEVTNTSGSTRLLGGMPDPGGPLIRFARLRNRGGTLSPGTTLTSTNGITQFEVTGEISITNAVSENILRVDLDPAFSNPLSRSDHLIGFGAVTLNGGYLHLFPKTVPAVGQTFLVIDKKSSGNIDGTFLDVPNNGLIAAQDGLSLYRLNYRAGDGNDAVLTRVANASSVPVITSFTSVRSPTVPANNIVTLQGTAAPYQRVVLQSSTSTTGFTDVPGTILAGSDGGFGTTLSVVRATTPRQFYRFRTWAD